MIESEGGDLLESGRSASRPPAATRRATARTARARHGSRGRGWRGRRSPGGCARARRRETACSSSASTRSLAPASASTSAIVSPLRVRTAWLRGRGPRADRERRRGTPRPRGMPCGSPGGRARRRSSEPGAEERSAQVRRAAARARRPAAAAARAGAAVAEDTRLLSTSSARAVPGRGPGSASPVRTRGACRCGSRPRRRTRAGARRRAAPPRCSEVEVQRDLARPSRWTLPPSARGRELGQPVAVARRRDRGELVRRSSDSGTLELQEAALVCDAERTVRRRSRLAATTR